MPRFGFAYQLGQKSVVRGGYGLYYGALGQRRGDVISTNFSQTTNLIPTTDNGITFNASLATPYPSGILAAQKSGQGASTFLGQSLPTLYNRDLPAQREQHWHVALQHQLPGGIVVEIGYLGSRGSNLQTTRALNYVPSQYLSHSGTRDQPVIDYLTGNVPNPFAGLLPGTSYNNSVIARSALFSR